MNKLDMSVLRQNMDEISAKIKALKANCDIVDGSPYNGVELPEAVTAVCQQLVEIGRVVDLAWVDMFGKSAMVIKPYFSTTTTPDMKTVHDFILVHAPELQERLYWSANEKGTL